jgi:hypothetical protein
MLAPDAFEVAPEVLELREVIQRVAHREGWASWAKAGSIEAAAQRRERDRRDGAFRKRQLEDQGRQGILENLLAIGSRLVFGLRERLQSLKLWRRILVARSDR